MSSTTTLDITYQRVMEVTGFYRNGVPTPGVIDTASIRDDLQFFDKRIKYNVAIDRDLLNATAIYELSGSPCIYFTQIDQADPDPKHIADLHKTAWNNGMAPILWVVTPTKVLLYNNYSRPSPEDETDKTRHLIELFEVTDSGLKELEKHVHRLQFESGAFWQWEKAKRIDRQQRVDKVLVDDLTETEKKLVEEQGLARSVAQALIIQSIFIAYLQDRGILTVDFFQECFQVESFLRVLESKSLTEQIFDWVRETFNGDLFALSAEDRKRIQPQHLEVIKAFIGGDQDSKTGQLRLWKFYDFKVIPVELISSIYEKFIYAENTESAKQYSTYYTPINLVDLVLSEVFKSLDGKAKILDLSCGSGVFLVESLRRLIVKRCMAGERCSRQLVRDTLYNQIYGVDINENAIKIAAFSLYLTALEMDYELSQNSRIMENLKFDSLIGKNLFIGDVFKKEAEFFKLDLFANKVFDAIVGNPPWTKSASIKSAIEYCKSQEHPTAYGTPPDQAFLWRVGDFINEKTQIGLILHGKAFFSKDPKAKVSKKELFFRFQLKIIINLSKLSRDKLFPKSEAPALIIIATGKIPDRKDKCYFVCPERSLDYRKHGVIEISPENIKTVSVYDLALNSDLFKIVTWGNSRDKYFIENLKLSFPTLEKIAKTTVKSGLLVGSQNSDASTKTIPQEFAQMKFLSSGELTKYQVNTSKLKYFNYEKVESYRDINNYNFPLIIISEKVTEDGLVVALGLENVIYRKSYSGISLTPDKIFIARSLNGILNSSLINYFIFMTSSSWGIERKKVMTQDLQGIPIPDLENTNPNLMSRLLEIEEQLRECSDRKKEKQLKKQLDGVVFDLYGLSTEERILVEDMNRLTIDLYMNREKSRAILKPSHSELESYAECLIGVIRPFLQTLNERKMIAEIIDVAQAPLQVVKFSMVPVTDRSPTIQRTEVRELQEILKSIAGRLSKQIADRIYTRRNLRIYLENELYIIKPAKKIYWSRSAGLNDADIILAEHLGVNNASLG